LKEPKNSAIWSPLVQPFFVYFSVTHNFESILQDKEIDLVVISTPPYLHKSMSEKVISAGKHLLLEKPMVMDTIEATKV
jgi:scyllo-inositol 2-dehydrogenase (NADP+)